MNDRTQNEQTNSPKTKRLLTRGLTALALAFVALGAAPACKHSPEERAVKVVKHVSRKLDLNEAQKAELEKLASEAAADFKSTRPQRAELAKEVEKQVLAEKADVTEIRKLMDGQQARRKEMMDKWLTKVADFHAKLTPEQKQKAAELMKKHARKFKGRFGDDDDSSSRE